MGALPAERPLGYQPQRLLLDVLEYLLLRQPVGLPAGLSTQDICGEPVPALVSPARVFAGPPHPPDDHWDVCYVLRVLVLEEPPP